jgi:hypothetical protein
VTEDELLGRRVRVGAADLDRWCRRHLGTGVDQVLFSAGHLSTVLGVELASGRQVVVKIRHRSDRLTGCAAVHRRLFDRGFPCPEPLIDLEPMGSLAASAEAMVSGGSLYPPSGRTPGPFAEALATLVALAPPPTEVASLDPLPAWMTPDLDATALWPAPDDSDVDLNALGGPAWIDHAAWVARSRLAASALPVVVGHGDIYTGNMTGSKIISWPSGIGTARSRPPNL